MEIQGYTTGGKEETRETGRNSQKQGKLVKLRQTRVPGGCVCAGMGACTCIGACNRHLTGYGVVAATCAFHHSDLQLYLDVTMCPCGDCVGTCASPIGCASIPV